MALDDVTVLSIVVVVAQGRLYRQVRYWCVADAVPTLVQGNGTLILRLDDGTANREGDGLLNLDSIRLLRRDDHIRCVVGGQPLIVLIGQCQAAAQVSQNVALCPRHAAQQVVQVEQLLAQDIE